jgi:hypothetical protein
MKKLRYKFTWNTEEEIRKFRHESQQMLSPIKVAARVETVIFDDPVVLTALTIVVQEMRPAVRLKVLLNTDRIPEAI